MSRAVRQGPPAFLAPFAVRSFRYQFPADMVTSWGSEMEILILGWYILTSTGSVVLLTVYGALQYLGTLISPLIGLAGDRVSHRIVLCAMRAVYALMAVTMTALSYFHLQTPLAVLLIAAVEGLIRPSDLAMRNALVAETIPPDGLMPASGIARTTSDSARIFGSMAGAALFALLGMTAAYVFVTLFYCIGLLLTLNVGNPRARHVGERSSAWGDLREGLSFIWNSPESLAAMWLALLVNLTGYPMTLGLLPYVAKQIYHVGQTGLGTLVASSAIGATTGSFTLGVIGGRIRPARMMLIFAVFWYVMLLAFIHAPGILSGRLFLVLAGFGQSMSLVPMAVLLLHSAGARFRGRVMGVRMLAIYGLPVGLLAAGPLIERFGYAATTTAYCVVGLTLTGFIAVRWRAVLWPPDAPGNVH